MALTSREAYDVIAALRLRGDAGDGAPSHADELAVRIAALAPDLEPRVRREGPGDRAQRLRRN
eukprot:232508-Alexandrium_andersonii.AAC.1